MVDYIGTARLRDLLSRIGIGRFIEELAGEIEADYRRWDDFEKSPRHASHSSVGVIELMPTSDGRLYSFKYVNGHPEEHGQESAHRHRLRRARGRRHGLPLAAVGDDLRHGAAHRRNLGARGTPAWRVPAQPRDGR